MNKQITLLLHVLVLVATVATGTIAHAASTINGDITADTTWTKANSPYNVGDVTVRPGATLTIEPGVEVRFAANSGLSVLGTLHAQGTAEQPIRFTGSAQTPGSWRGIDFTGTSAAPLTGSILDHAIVEYGGLPFSNGANIHLQYAQVTISYSLVRDGARAGVYAEAGGVANMSDSTFTSNAGEAIVFADGSVNPDLARLHLSANGSDTIGMGGGMLVGQHIWEAAGAPYHALPGNTVLTVAPGATLTIQPGVTVVFDTNALLQVAGTLKAEGTTDLPITMTAVNKQAGAWQGIGVRGSSAQPAAAILRFATVDFGGINSASGAALSVTQGQLLMDHSIIRNSPSNGITLGVDGGNSNVATTQFVNIPGYSIYNSQPERPMLAANNWWGAANGPNAENGCASGSGGKVSAGVIVAPFLSSPNADPVAIPASDARLLSLKPQRWFAPADGVTRVWVDVTLRDGAGNPLPGRKVKLQASRGKIVDGGITDVQGHTFAYLTSQSAGDTTISALLDQTASCEFARSSTASVTFTPDTGANDQASSIAPYIDGTITISPMPLTRGVPAKLSATVANPGNTPLSVEGTFGYAQSGIGLTFGPLAQAQRLTIAPHSSATFSTPFTPPLDGHYCFVFDYTSTPAQTRAATISGGRSGHMQVNAIVNYDSSAGRFPNFLDGVTPGPERPPWSPDEGIDASLSHFWRSLFSNLSLAGQNYQNANSNSPLNRWENSHTRATAQAATAPEYQHVSTPRQLTLPPRQPGNGVSPARAAAENAGTTALVKALVNVEAATTASQRYRMASQAGDLQWASIQASAADFYAQAAAGALNDSADAIDQYAAVLRNEHVTTLPISLADARKYQEQLRTQGFSAEDVAELRQIGMSDTAIEAERQGLMALAPERLTGDAITRLDQIAKAYRGMANDLRGGTRFAPASQAATRASGQQSAPNKLARVGEIQQTIQIGNPFASATTVALRVRPVNLPPDWVVTLSASSLSLAPGQQQPITVTIIPGTAVQGSLAQVAVEGYANNTLIDGVAFDVPIPEQRSFERPFAVFLPTVVQK